MPRGVELAWRSARGTKPGPRPALTLERIVGAAIEVADEAGLAAVSLARVAAALGCATTSLYRHVRAKDDLVVLMCDAAAAPPADLPAPDPLHWQRSLRDLASRIFQLYRAHPWALDVPPSGPPTTPNQLLWGEHLLRALSRTTLTYADQLRTITLITGYAREQARLATDPVIARDEAPAAEDGGYFQLLSAVMTPDRYPMFCRVLADDELTTGIGYTDEDFEFGLARILTGLTELNERQPPP
ncbi:TetR/AcrR family transcriptional regulator [Tenggerimyces flavus]|uniref:TetR/AcrR family transcriptional regulator n=1 Tax=Tenggerimyces flavus TaxID=1708749 RepID=A0ABV7YE15_9ACTN|nr:TetR/AcrR family transcriptional regulator [Tenggerimyces flavus]MBM7786895.1 AcrR family transcriptional regulator [Tenggerimyces flavus]